MKARLTNSDYCRAANHLGCEVAAIKAVAEQESLGAGFDSQDRPKILFERHLFHKLTRGVYDRTHPGISNPSQGGYGPSASQYGRFAEAFNLNPTAAMMAASWGKFQILGSNFGICGFLTVNAFVDSMKESEANQLNAFCEFVLHNGLDDELTDHDWAGFARGYNGKNFKINNYDVKIGKGYTKFVKEKIDCGQLSTTVTQSVDVPPIPEVPEVLPNDSAGIDPNTENSAEIPATPQPLVGEVEVKPETPSLYTKVGAAFTAIMGFGFNIGSFIQTRLESMTVQQVGFMIASLGLVAGAIYWYRKSSAAAQARTMALVATAANPNLNTVAIVPPK